MNKENLLTNRERARLVMEQMKVDAQWKPAEGDDWTGETCDVDPIPYIAQALQEKDEAHKAEIARIREAIDQFLRSTMKSYPNSDAWSREYSEDCIKAKRKLLAAFDSAVNGKEL